MLALALVWRTRHPAWWLAVGAAAGLGAISKYTNLFFGLGVLALIILDRRERRWLLDPWACAGVLIAILIFLPVFVWNAQHHWVSFAKQFGRIAPHGVHLLFVPELVLAQTGLLNPIVAVFVVMGVVACLQRRGDPNGAIGFWLLSRPLSSFICSCIPFTIVCKAIGLRQSIRRLPYLPQPLPCRLASVTRHQDYCGA